MNPIIAGRATGMRMLVLMLAALLLAACGQSRVVREAPARPAPARMAPSAAGASVIVQRGDTLYGIAFRHGLDYRDVAAWNRIGAPYTIYPGQRLRLRGAAASTPLRSSPARTVASQPSRATAPTATRPPGAVTSMPVRPNPAQAPTDPATPTRLAPAAPMPTHSGRWLWPTGGQIIGRYVAGDPTKQGIDIAGPAGQPVLAAGDGVVVYSGTGLVGYGEVIIVKHNDEWLSAYGHNRKRLVAEGDPVKAGQTIAELGRSGTSRDMLHFEIRRNGKPVDPLSLLPPPR